MEKTINVAIVGLGFMGVTHIKAYRKTAGVRLAAVCDAARLPVDGDLSHIYGNIGSAEPVKLDMSQLKATKNFDDLLGDPEIDLIDICVPTLAHPKLAIAALKAGKHVICEKPLARTSAAAREIAAAAADARGYFMPAMVMRFWPEWAWIRKAIVEGTYGRVLAARFRRVCEPPVWAPEPLDGVKSGGALLDLHIHDTDFVQFCFGRPKSVYSTGFSWLSGEVDHVVTQYHFDSGVCVTAEGGWSMTPGFGFNMACTVIFENATADYDISRGPEAMRLIEKGKPTRTWSDVGDAYQLEVEHIVNAIRAGTPPSVVNAADGASAVEICEAESESVKTGKIVLL